MISFPTTADTPRQVAILPDWGTPIRQATIYRTDVTRSRNGLEQRAQRRRKPGLTMQYEIATKGSDATQRLDAAIAMARGPLHVPWWPHGLPLVTGMASATAVVLNGTPIADDWDKTGWIFLWHPTEGTEWRILSGRTGQNLTLTSTGTHVTFPDGSWAFPVRLAVRDRAEAFLSAQHHAGAIESLIFRTL